MVDDEWDSFLSGQNECGFSSSKTSFIENNNIVDEISGDVPECQDLYISTTTKNRERERVTVGDKTQSTVRT